MSEQVTRTFATETKLGLDELQKIAPGRPSLAALWRWCIKGIRGVRLEYERQGRRMFSSAEALARFRAALTALDQAATDQPKPSIPKTSPPRRSSARARSIAGAKRRLAEAGI